MRKLLLIILIVLGKLVFSQGNITDSVFQLKEVKINASRINDFSVGLNVERIDSIFLSNSLSSSLGNILSSVTSVFIKNYGQGSLATISLRGTSSVHTGVFWNGFRINPSSIGMTDFSLIPSSFFESIELQYGGASSLHGNGLIGGSIHLNNPVVFEKKLSLGINSSYGSFDNISLGGNVLVSNEKWFSSTAFTLHNSENNFLYKYGNESKTQTNAALKQYSFIQNVSRKISKDQTINAGIWYQFSNREIPGTMTSKPGNAYQIDKSLRTTINWEKVRSNQKIKAGIAFFTDFLHYLDVDDIPETNIDSKLNTRTIIAEADWKKYFGKNIIINTGINFTTDIANIDAYEGIKSQKQAGVFLSFSKRFPKINWNSNINIRQEFIEGYNVPLSPSIGFEGNIWKFISGKINISRNFRAPTLNDRFWQPGGNENLKPEQSWNEEAGLILKFFNQKPFNHNTEIAFTIYNSMVDNWILWKPLAGSALWSPQNIQKVWSRGYEIKALTKINFYGLIMTFLETYTFSKSTFQEQIGGSDNTYEKQLIYTPMHNFSSSSNFVYKSWFVNYSQTYTGKRFVSADNENFLSGFSIGQFSFGKTINLKTNTININFKINNVWKSDYQIIQYRQMPGRSFLISINYKFKK
ncbi:MAG: TonB-dependent receptor plug domain-containing protein [Bacteroidales bacterium]|nr:TonB-dependent receptor plug domain-containing protein [Bacteroidales bacterium]